MLRDIENGAPSIATAWNVTNTAILALFIGAALREQAGRGQRAAASAVVPTPPAEFRTIVARPAPRERVLEPGGVR